MQAPGGGALGPHALARVDTHAAFSDLFAGPKLKVRRLPRKHPYKDYILSAEVCDVMTCLTNVNANFQA